MPAFTDVAALIPTLCVAGTDVDDAESAQASLMLMADADVVRVLEETSDLMRQVEKIKVAAAGVIAVRSKREHGHSGLSAARGHRSAASLIQDVTGSTKSEAHRTARVGEALLDEQDAGDFQSGDGGGASAGAGAGADAGAGSESDPDAGDSQSARDERRESGPWFQPLRDALRQGTVTSAQFDAIRRGLGEPPEIDSDQMDAGACADAREEARAAWAQAARQLVDEAAARTVEELWQQARTVRDLLDPEGAETRYLARFEKRSFRMYRGSGRAEARQHHFRRRR